MNDNHVFKWVDEAFTHEIEQLEFQLGVLEEEVRVMKMERNQERMERDPMEKNKKGKDFNMVIIFSSGCLITMAIVGMLCLS
ncbi:hypothetical protein AtNW77_Chr3g0172381 [Arabidopsis thaliana]|uniref:Transmembrane protein n=1 Tax=Arabidopsis thaliana TaxID=3702 RepID=A0A5S9XTN0_ARATH|nr:unnamed protein product [Arabidopsis thaliana]